MSVLIKPFYGVAQGRMYPRWYPVNAPCPAELVAAAQAAGALAQEPASDKPTVGDKGKKAKV